MNKFVLKGDLTVQVFILGCGSAMVFGLQQPFLESNHICGMSYATEKLEHVQYRPKQFFACWLEKPSFGMEIFVVLS